MLLSLVIIIPILHLQIGIINDLLDKFYDWTDERIENITDKEREARFLRLDCEIEYDKAMKALHDFDHDQLEALRDRRKEINKIMKRKDTMKETKINLGQEKTTLATRIKILEKERRSSFVSARMNGGPFSKFLEMPTTNCAKPRRRSRKIAGNTSSTKS